jgi:hypothetical protein
MLKAYKFMLCRVDERESINPAKASSVKDAPFKDATCLGTAAPMLGIVEGIFLHLCRYKSKDCIKCFDAIYPMSGCPTDSCF